jgi:hypothetical protein
MLLTRIPGRQTFNARQQVRFARGSSELNVGILLESQLVYNRPDLLMKAPKASADYTA